MPIRNNMMVDRDVHIGRIGENFSCAAGLFLIQASNEHDQARIVLTREQVEEHIFNLRSLLDHAAKPKNKS